MAASSSTIRRRLVVIIPSWAVECYDWFQKDTLREIITIPGYDYPYGSEQSEFPARQGFSKVR
jgi:hypothetical protein